MGYPRQDNGLSFEALRRANLARFPLFRNSKGEWAHKFNTIDDWTPDQWLKAVLGELGEYANLSKKYDRGDVSTAEFLIEGANEIADVLIYLDLMAARWGFDLGEIVKHKFNQTSKKVGAPVVLCDSEWVQSRDLTTEEKKRVKGLEEWK